MLHISNIIYDTSADGPGLRHSIYVQGCDLNCPGCHNPSARPSNPKVGAYYHIDELCLELAKDAHISGISVLGGEPSLQSYAVARFITLYKTLQPKKTVWLWSGRTYEYLLAHCPTILEHVDVLVDGPYVESKRCDLPYRGSSNQRVIDVPKSLFSGQVVLFE